MVADCKYMLDTTLDGKDSIYSVCFLQDSKHNSENKTPSIIQKTKHQSYNVQIDPLYIISGVRMLKVSQSKMR
jgi:hypothetical protein